MRSLISISVIIPMRNEQGYAARCVDSVLAQIQGRQDIEILCVDGASTDRTREIVADYCRRDSRIRLIDNPVGIVPVGMNLGISQAQGDVIIRLDCHAVYPLDYIAKCVEVLRRTCADNVGGYVITLSGSTTEVGRAIAAATSSRFGVGGSAFRTGGNEQEVDTVPFGCFRRDVFQRFGLYDERLVRNQDIELNSRIRKRGGKVIISPEIQSTYYNRSTFAGLRQQAFHNGVWNPYTVYLCGGGLRVRHFVPLAFVLGLIGLSVAGFVWPVAWIGLAVISIVYLVSAGVMARKAGDGSRISPGLVLLAFIHLHLSYGIGSLWGILTAPWMFGIRRRPVQLGTLPNRRD